MKSLQAKKKIDGTAIKVVRNLFRLRKEIDDTQLKKITINL